MTNENRSSKALPKAWCCPQCGEGQYPYRDTCDECGEPRPSWAEPRTSDATLTLDEEDYAFAGEPRPNEAPPESHRMALHRLLGVIAEHNEATGSLVDDDPDPQDALDKVYEIASRALWPVTRTQEAIPHCRVNVLCDGEDDLCGCFCAACTEDATPDATKDYDKSIHANPDASAWAAFFKKTCDSLGKECDEAWMQTWFANAMMAMHDHLKSQEKRTDNPHPGDWDRTAAESHCAKCERCQAYKKMADDEAGRHAERANKAEARIKAIEKELFALDNRTLQAEDVKDIYDDVRETVAKLVIGGPCERDVDYVPNAFILRRGDRYWTVPQVDRRGHYWTKDVSDALRFGDRAQADAVVDAFDPDPDDPVVVEPAPRPDQGTVRR